MAELRPLVLQDGSALASHDGWREVLPGRGKVVKPAAVALHPPRALLGAAPTTVVLPPDTTKEQACVPEPASLRARVLLAARGDRALHAMRRVQDEGGFLLIRAKAGRHPQVIEAFCEDGTRRRSRRPKALKALHAPRPTRQRVARVGEGQGEGQPLRLRLLLSWTPQTQECCSVLPNLPAQR